MKKLLYVLTAMLLAVSLFTACSKGSGSNAVDPPPQGGGGEKPPQKDTTVTLTLVDNPDTFQIGVDNDLILSKIHIPNDCKNFTITQLRNPAQDTGYVTIDNYNYLLYKATDNNKTPEASGLFNTYDFTTAVSIAIPSGIDHVLVSNGHSSKKGKYQGQNGFQCSYTVDGVVIKKEIAVVSHLLVFK